MSMVVDLHVHVGEMKISLDQVVQAGKDKGLDGLCITDHDRFPLHAEMLRHISRLEGFHLFCGMEVKCLEGHVVTFGYPHSRERILSFDELRQRVGADGVMICAHRYNDGAASLGDVIYQVSDDLVALESFCGDKNPEHVERVIKAAKVLNLPTVGSSDAHSPSALGSSVTVFADDFDDEDGLIDALKAGRFRARQGPPANDSTGNPGSADVHAQKRNCICAGPDRAREEFFSDPEPYLRALAATYADADSLRERLLADRHGYVRCMVARYASSDALRGRLVGDPDSKVRQTVAEYAASDEVRQELVDDAETAVRTAVASFLHSDDLRRCLMDDGAVAVRHAVARFARSNALREELLSDDHWAVRYTAAEWDKSHRMRKRLLDDPDPMVRDAAAKYLLTST